MSELKIPFVNPITKERLQQLFDIISPGPVLILTHDNPDPDALSSGKALAFLFSKAWGIPSRLIYYGLVARAENKTMLNLLTPEWEHGDVLEDLDQYSAIALLDTQPGAGNNRFPEGEPLSVVIDHHHPIRQGLEQVPFVDVRPEIGATASIIYQYLEAMNLTPDADLATAIFYGVRTDTRALSRDSSTTDQYVYFKLLSLLDHEKLVSIENAGLPQEYFQAFHKGLMATKVFEKVIVSYQGELPRPDFSAEMADLLIRHEKIEAVLCMGYHGDVLQLSMRTNSDELDAGEIILKLVSPPAKAGGHGRSAGGQISLKNFQPEYQAAEVEKKFLKVMGENGMWKPLLIL